MGPTLALIFLFLMPIGCSSQACEVLNKFPKIEENSPVGTLVTEILLGTGYTVNVEPRNTFMMNGSQLQMSREVDFEVDQLVRAMLTCNLNDVFASREDVFVEILDVNDNEAKFKHEIYRFNISEDHKVNSSIGNAIEAEDADQDTLYYTLSGNVNSLAYFRLSSETNPVILVNKRLDFDDAPNVNLNLTVRDRLDPTERPIHSATASIMIKILDADDKPPFFLPCTAISTKICINYGYTGSVTRTELATGPLILSPGPIYAVDGDWGIGASVEYSILNGNNDNVFNVHTTSGNITMNKAVNTLENFILQVMAYQTDDQAKYSTTSVIIEVKEKNNFPPTFEKSIYYGIIPSDSAIGTFVLDLNDRLRTLVVFAADDDFPDKQNPSLVYMIDNSTAFRILRDGYILTDAVITTPGTIVLQVSATDSSTNEKATTLVSVEVIAATTTIPTTTTTTRSPTATNIGTTTTTTPGTGTTTTTTKGTGTTTTSTPGTGTTTTKGTGTTTTSTPGTGTTTTITKGTGTTTMPTPGTGTTTTTTKGTGTTTTSTPGTGTTTTTTKGTGTTTTSTPGTGTTTTTTKGTGTTTTSTPGSGTTTITTKGTGTTTTSTPGTGTTTTTTKGTGTTTTSTPGTGTTTATTKGTGTTTTSTPGSGTTTITTKGTGTTTTSTPGTGTTTTTTKGTGTTTTSTPGTGTTTTTTKGTGTITTSTPGTGTITTTTKDTGRTITSAPATGLIPTTSNGISTITTRTSDTGTATKISPGADTTQSTDTRTEFTEKALSSYTATDMAALGASLGAILALCLVLLGFLIHKQYGNSIKRKLGRGFGDNSGSPQNSAEQLINDTDDPTNDFPDYGGFATTEPVSTSVTIATDAALGSAPSQSDPADNQPSEIVEADDSDDKKVKSILTKELKEDAGYKAVWFREDASPEVVVIEGVEDGEADDYDNEDNFDNQQGDDEDDDDDDEEDLDPTFNVADNQPENSIL